MEEQTIRRGDLVRKKTEYEYIGYVVIGYVVADFVKTTGERRIVVEEMKSGMLHIFTAAQVETFQYEKGKCGECGQDKIFYY